MVHNVAEQDGYEKINISIRLMFNGLKNVLILLWKTSGGSE